MGIMLWHGSGKKMILKESHECVSNDFFTIFIENIFDKNLHYEII